MSPFSNLINPDVIKQMETDNISKLEGESTSTMDKYNSIVDPFEFRPVTYENVITTTILHNLKRKFNRDIDRYPNIEDELKDNARKYFGSVLEKFNLIFLDKIIFGFTDSNSLYYRFGKNDYVCNLEVYYDYSKTEADDIEAIVSIKKNNLLILNQFGSLDNVFNQILSLIEPHKNETFDEQQSSLNELSV